MRYRRLGSSGCKVSTISLGSWLTFGEAVDQETTNACVRTAVESDINFFDTADIYSAGKAEEALQIALSPFSRSSYVLATKVFWPSSPGVNGKGLSRKHIMEGCEASLRRLGTDYIDLFQCHRFDPETPVEETVRGMEDLIRQGKILYWGTSQWEAGQMTTACNAADQWNAYRPITNQPEYNMIEWSIENEVMPTCDSLGMGQIVYCPLAQGILTGKYNDGDLPVDSRANREAGGKFVKPRLTENNLTLAKRVSKLASQLDLTPGQLALAWILKRSEISSAITGATRPEHVRENAAAAEVDLDANTVEILERWKRGED